MTGPLPKRLRGILGAKKRKKEEQSHTDYIADLKKRAARGDSGAKGMLELHAKKMLFAREWYEKEDPFAYDERVQKLRADSRAGRITDDDFWHAFLDPNRGRARA